MRLHENPIKRESGGQEFKKYITVNLIVWCDRIRADREETWKRAVFSEISIIFKSPNHECTCVLTALQFNCRNGFLNRFCSLQLYLKKGFY